MSAQIYVICIFLSSPTSLGKASELFPKQWNNKATIFSVQEMINTPRQQSETFLHDTTQSGLQKPVPTTHDNLLLSFSLLYSKNNIFDAFFFY